jgi:hypothetical protein
MGDLSEHFSKRDFFSKNPNQRGYYKISLVLVGYLELIREHFKQHVEVVKGYITADEAEKEGSFKKNWHAFGKAVAFKVQNVEPIKVFQFCDQLKELTGVGIDPVNGTVHIDVRDRETLRYVVEAGINTKLTPELRQKYNLGAEPAALNLKEVTPIKSMLDDDDGTPVVVTQLQSPGPASPL